jgi:hypothetical protein
MVSASTGLLSNTPAFRRTDALRENDALGGFYAFRDHALQAVSHRGDGLRDRRVVLVARQIEHERAVDFRC